MAFDDFTDVQVSAAAMLASAAATADCGTTANATTDDQVVNTTITWPFRPGTAVPGQRYPVLAVYRVSEAWFEASPWDAYSDSIYRVEYWLPDTPDSRVQSRWKMLHQVWRAIAKAWQAGWHPSHSSGALVFQQAGLRAELGATTRVTYSLGAPTDGGTFPHFVADVTIRESIADDVGVEDIAGLPDFEINRMQIDLHETAPPAGTPTINQRIDVEGYTEGFDLTTQGGESLTVQGDGDELETQ